jgi:hypothetical protein
MAQTFLKTLFIAFGIFCVNKGFTQAVDTGNKPHIVIISKLEKPKNAAAFKEKDFAGYLLVYFKDPTHSAYFAVSADGYNFTDLNDGKPIFIGSELAEQKGVRDPHITRGPDGAFYLAMTDLHIFGQRAGFRDSAWERPLSKYGWGNKQGNRTCEIVRPHSLDAFRFSC